MSEVQQTIHEIEESIEDAKKVVAFGEAIKRLSENKDYQTVVVDGYCRDEASRLTLLLAHPDVDEKMRTNILNALQGISEFHGFIRARANEAIMKAAGIQEAQEMLVTLYDEENEE